MLSDLRLISWDNRLVGNLKKIRYIDMADNSTVSTDAKKPEESKVCYTFVFRSLRCELSR
jgi:hypothetical protein